MTPYLQLDLNAITIDAQLARRVPYALSAYYLALPLGQENGCVSVAMTYPENEKARQILARLLQAEIVPIFVPVETLQAALNRIYCPEQSQTHNILAWYGQPEWETAVTTTATALSGTFQTKAATLTIPELALTEALTLAQAGQYELTVCPLPAGPTLFTILKAAQTSLFFVQGAPQPIRRILSVMRGFASDERALDWLTPFARWHGATVTLMPLMNRTGPSLKQYHHHDSPVGQHLARCLQHLHTAGVPVDLKFRQGNAIQQVVEEVTGDTYDVLALAAEAEGDFVGRVITAVTQHNAHNDRPIFILKPPALPQIGLTE